jgi:hypothetical protein
MANQLRQQIEQISREKNINPDVIIAAIEDAILTASKKYYKGAEDLRSRFNEESGQIEVFAVKQIVETVEIPETQMTLDEAREMFPGAEVELGQEIEFPKPTDVLGRIAAQTAKQVIFQKVREAERDNVFAEYSAGWARSSTASSSARRWATSWWTSAGPRPSCPARSRAGPRPTRPATGCAWPSCGWPRRPRAPR